MAKIVKFGLCKGRHNIPDVTEYVFCGPIDPLDVEGLYNMADKSLCNVLSTDTVLHIYVTGLTVALAAVIKWCLKYSIPLTLYHFDRDTNTYYPQEIID